MAAGVDTLLNVFVMNAFLSFPGILLAIAFVAFLGPGLLNLVLALAIGGWVGYARLVRAQVLAVKEREFVEAARALGASDLRIFYAPHPAQHPSTHHRAGRHRHGGSGSGRSHAQFSWFGAAAASGQLGRNAE